VHIIGVDFETAYDRQYSLSKITTEEYIRDPRFEVIGVGVKVDADETQWFSGTKAQTKRWLEQFPWDDAVAVAHNALFDMAILSWVFGIRPKRIADTLSMARALHGAEGGSLSLKGLAEKYGLGVKGTEVENALGKWRLDFTKEELARYAEYCCNDVELTCDLFAKLAVGFPLSELRLIDLTIRMFSEPVLELDRHVLVKHLEAVKAKKDDLLGKAMIDKEQLMSNPKLAQLLRDLGVEPPMKISPTTGKETYAFAKSDEAFKALLEHENIFVQAIVAARLGVKSTLEETRTERFIGIAERGKLPIPLRYYGAHTGRWSGLDLINMQNIPRISPLKKAITAQEGYVLGDVDSSQIEARTLAWLAGQQDLVEFFQKNNDEIAAGVPKAEMQYDPYKIMASQIYGVPVDAVDGAKRQVGKVTILGAGYGLGWRKFVTYAKQQGVEADDDFAQRIIHTYREAYPMIPELWKRGDTAIRAMIGGQTAPLDIPDVLVVNDPGVDVPNIKLPNGMHLIYPNLRLYEDPETGKRGVVYDTKRGRSTLRKGLWGGSLAENYTQAVARIIVGEQMLMVARRYKVAMTVHDSIVVAIPEAEASEGLLFVEQCMRIRPKWAGRLPLNCEGKTGASYGG
jgi:DNA polymerase I-like protein with 3'-5' exonuclease and polymerase domains